MIDCLEKPNRNLQKYLQRSDAKKTVAENILKKDMQVSYSEYKNGIVDFDLYGLRILKSKEEYTIQLRHITTELIKHFYEWQQQSIQNICMKIKQEDYLSRFREVSNRTIENNFVSMKLEIALLRSYYREVRKMILRYLIEDDIVFDLSHIQETYDSIKDDVIPFLNISAMYYLPNRRKVTIKDIEIQLTTMSTIISSLCDLAIRCMSNLDDLFYRTDDTNKLNFMYYLVTDIITITNYQINMGVEKLLVSSYTILSL